MCFPYFLGVDFLLLLLFLLCCFVVNVVPAVGVIVVDVLIIITWSVLFHFCFVLFCFVKMD